MTAVDFAVAARSLGCAARLRELVVPVFASPPPRADLDRSIRRREGAPLVSVRLRGRPREAVVADMIEGIVVANDLTGPRAGTVRAALWLAVATEEDAAANAAGPSRNRPERRGSVGSARSRSDGEAASRVAA